MRVIYRGETYDLVDDIVKNGTVLVRHPHETDTRVAPVGACTFLEDE